MPTDLVAISCNTILTVNPMGGGKTHILAREINHPVKISGKLLVANKKDSRENVEEEVEEVEVGEWMKGLAENFRPTFPPANFGYQLPKITVTERYISYCISLALML